MEEGGGEGEDGRTISFASKIGKTELDIKKKENSRPYYLVRSRPAGDS